MPADPSTGLPPDIPSTGFSFRDSVGADSRVFHTAPRRQFVVGLSGATEIELADGTRRRFGPGDVLLADDTTGQGHRTQVVEAPRRSLFIYVPDTVDPRAWVV